ncbi:hypothetical protein [Maribacter sp. 2307UL18-2]
MFHYPVLNPVTALEDFQSAHVLIPVETVVYLYFYLGETMLPEPEFQ